MQILVQSLLTLAIAAQPLIGVLTVPSELEEYSQNFYSTIEATYVKYIESAGAQVVPIPWDANYSELEFLFDHLNGILFTGGDTLIYLNETSPGFSFNKFTDTVSFIIEKAIQVNKAGKIYPLFGYFICQGFQVMNYVMSNYFPVLERVYDNLEKERLFNLTYTDSYMFGTMAPAVKVYIQKEVGPFEFNEWAVFQDTYDRLKTLADFFQVVGYSYDGRGQVYIAAIEAKNYPFHAFQFHPEKHQFEFNSPATHTKEMINYGQHLINKFVSLSRKNKNSMAQAEFETRSIYGHSPQFVDLDYLSQMYVLNRTVLTGSGEEGLGVHRMKTQLLRMNQ